VRFFITCIFFSTAFSVLQFPCVKAAQQDSTLAPSKKPLTNQDIVQMVAGQFADSTIVKTIQANDTDFDLSVTALVALKDAGVSQTVIEAMLSVSATNNEGKTVAVAKKSAANLQPGAYYWSGNSWTPMQQITMSGGGATHMGKMFVPGLTPQMVWTFRDPHAPVQVQRGLPLFCFKFLALPPGMPYAPSGRDIVIARFDQRKDHRELQTTSGGNMFTFKSGLSKERAPDIEVSTVDSSTFLVSPKTSLPPGEYLLSGSSMGINGYDFGFHPKE
jgi:hypothetical protein